MRENLLMHGAICDLLCMYPLAHLSHVIPVTPSLQGHWPVVWLHVFPDAPIVWQLQAETISVTSLAICVKIRYFILCFYIIIRVLVKRYFTKKKKKNRLLDFDLARNHWEIISIRSSWQKNKKLQFSKVYSNCFETVFYQIHVRGVYGELQGDAIGWNFL